ncbi:endonuclease domain-containing protein [Janthinobacterium sp. GB4P2]|uniref:endonuclease domain-containing protein n=1 Tax=Janthinobacterium sp. GB4P2 TaxID=3424189 RepID=UPI003F20EA2B
MSDFNKFLAIRDAYAWIIPEWMAEYASTGRMAHDPYFHEWEFSPIESNVWGDIRGLGLPFYPQVPALNYFLDFANPFLKIGIECDGKAWHDSEKDRVRDSHLADAGWMIFRLEGHECMREVDINGDEGDGDDGVSLDDVRRYFMSTSEGVLAAIRERYFGGRSQRSRDQFFVDATLFEHMSTPETFPVRREEVHRGPISFGDMMPEYIEVLRRRLDHGRAA